MGRVIGRSMSPKALPVMPAKAGVTIGMPGMRRNLPP